jgi:hypothetical protein
MCLISLCEEDNDTIMPPYFLTEVCERSSSIRVGETPKRPFSGKRVLLTTSLVLLMLLLLWAGNNKGFGFIHTRGYLVLNQNYLQLGCQNYTTIRVVYKKRVAGPTYPKQMDPIP